MVTSPIFFERNRVYRIYKGGMPYKKLFNDPNNYDDGTDNMFPEEWVASKVKAINPKYFGKRDGVSVVKGTDLFLDDLLNDYKDELLGNRKYDCLVKYLDSAVRLPFQVHPTKEFSRKYFNSEYGKTESWLVVGKRPGAKLYFGFKDKMTKEMLSELEERSEVEKVQWVTKDKLKNMISDGSFHDYGRFYWSVVFGLNQEEGLIPEGV